MKKISLLLLLVCLYFSHSALATPNLQIEVFDVTKSEVVKTIPLDENKRDTAITLVQSVESLYPKLNPTPKNGIMIKVPLDPKVRIDHELLNDPIIEVIFIFPEEERPYMLIFNEKKDHPLFYYFSEDSSGFLKDLGITL
ncbi:hypothetical protein [Sutcliffiella halmapala]|uniref:hypothetical protein n=1 Tax=Sutcliffiella halmapala TaxID=79882 RepID=UPI00099559E9|nr:hypothetical protein [Sutcliffiella halmapala]